MMSPPPSSSPRKRGESDIQIVDVSARDGLQNEPNAAQLSATDKAQYIGMLCEAGLTRIEAGSFVHPKVTAMANSGEVAELLRPVEKEFPQVIFSYLVPNVKGLERAKAARAKEIAIFLALSEKFSKANINQSVDESFQTIAPVIAEARKANIRVRGYISSLFGYDDLPFSPDQVAMRAKQLLDMGCFEVSLGDTTGIGKSEQISPIIDAIMAQNVPLRLVAMHFHDTFGNAMKNVEQSYELGIKTFDAATGGLGGCPYANSPKGNLAMEKLVSWAHEKKISCDVRDSKKLDVAAEFMLKKLGKV
jgi:hydroxymethylglutaryl-CoA lyase